MNVDLEALLIVKSRHNFWSKILVIVTTLLEDFHSMRFERILLIYCELQLPSLPLIKFEPFSAVEANYHSPIAVLAELAKNMSVDTPSTPDAAASTHSSNTERTRKRKRSSPNFSDPATLVTFFIGKGEVARTFIVHKEFACYYSSVLNDAFNSSFTEGKNLTYRLEDTTERAFRLFVLWLYTQKLDLLQLKEDWVDDAAYSDSAWDENDGSLVELWILADKLCIPQLQNLALESINKISDKLLIVPTGVFNYIYEHTVTGCQLRRFLVELCARGVKSWFYSVESDSFPKDMLTDLTTLYTTRQPYEADEEGDLNGVKEEEKFDISNFYVPVDVES